MAEVGVLQLTIEDNSESAAKGLERLADVLERVKNAVGNGLGLEGTSNEIEKIAKVVNDAISGSTITKLGQFADALKGLKGINLKSVANAMQGFDQGAAIENTKNQVNALSTEFTKAWTAMNTFYTKYAEIKSLVTGTNTPLLGSGGVAPENALSTQVWTGPNWSPDWTHGENFSTGWTSDIDKVREDAIEVEGTVSDAMEETAQAVSGAAGAISDGMTVVSGAMEGAAGSTGTVTDGMVEVEASVEAATGSAHRFADAMDFIKTKAKGAWSALTETRDGVNGLKGAFSAMFPTLSTFLSGMGRIAKYRLIRTVIKQITSGMSEGIQNVYHYSKAIGSSFAPAMDSAATALLQMKNSIGAALAPMIQSLIPYLQIVINWFINLINYVNQFVSLLRGQQTWTRAVPKTTQAFEDQTKAAKKTGAAIKDLLADWDELNIIQSESGGGGVGTGTSAAEDYLNMFEEVGKFNKDIKKAAEFIKNNIKDVVDMVKMAGLALLGWRFSKAFTGILGKLGSIIEIGILGKLTFDLAYLLDKAYAETKDVSLLIGDMALTGALAGIAGKLADAKFGKGAGMISAGLIFGISAGASFTAAEDVEDEAEKTMLQILGGVKIGIGSALAALGFIAKGVNPALAIVGGIVSVSLTALITYALEFSAKKAEEAKEMAEKAFAQSGYGGIDPQEYLDELQKKFDELTKGDKLVLDTFVEVPDLGNKLTNATNEIKALNPVVIGKDALTKEDAKKFKDTWKIILDTLDSMNSKTYDTILAGLDSALANANKDIQARISELRLSFIQIEKNLDEETAKLYKEMEDIVDKITDKTATDEDIKRYKFIWGVIAEATDESFKELQGVITKAKRFDFGTENALDNAKQFIKDIGNAGDQTSAAIQEALDDSLISLDMKRKRAQTLFDNNLINKDTYDQAMEAYQGIEDALLQAAKEKQDSVQESMQEAYDILFGQAVASSNGTPSYWRDVLLPLIKEIKKSGGTFSKEMMTALRESISGELFEISGFMTSPGKGTISGWKALDAEDIIKAIQLNLENNLEAAKGSMPDYSVEIIDMFNLTGWDLLTEEIKDDFARSLAEALGDTDKTRQVLEGLGYDQEKVAKLLNLPVQEAVEEALPEPIEAPAVVDVVPEVSEGTEASVSFDTEAVGGPMTIAVSDVEVVAENINTDEVKNAIKSALGDLEITDDERSELIARYGEKAYRQAVIDAMNEYAYGSNVDLMNRPTVQLDNGDYATLQTATYTASKNGLDGLEWSQDVIMNLTPILPDGTILDDDTLDNYVEDLLKKSGSVSDLFWNDKTENGGRGLLIQAFNEGWIDRYEDYKQAVQEAIDRAIKLHELQKEIYDGEEQINHGKVLNPSRLIASAGITSGVHWNTGTGQQGMTPMTAADTERQIANEVETGVRNANDDQNSLIRDLVSLVTKISQKQWVINVTPGSGWGQHNVQSAEAYNRVTG